MFAVSVLSGLAWDCGPWTVDLGLWAWELGPWTVDLDIHGLESVLVEVSCQLPNFVCCYFGGILGPFLKGVRSHVGGCGGPAYMTACSMMYDIRGR